MKISPHEAAKLLLEQDNIVIFVHRKPDGDTLGSSFALLYALETLGKNVRVECSDPLVHGRFGKIFGEYVPKEFAPAFVVAADVAGPDLLNGVQNRYGGKVDLCIDHHKSNELYAAHTLLDPSAASTAEIMYKVILELGVEPDKAMADALFTGLTTDTGCFKYANVTAETHRIAAEVIGWGADHAMINKLMFSTKSRGRLEVDRLMLDTLSYYFDGRCAMIYLDKDIAARHQVTEEELDGISAFPRSIEGVVAGITIREREDGAYRISLRTESPIDASRICALFDGGGHMNAAGCTLTGDLNEVKEKLLSAVEGELGAQGA